MSYPRGLPTKVLLYNFSHKSEESENERDDKQCTASLYNTVNPLYLASIIFNVFYALSVLASF